MRAAVKTLIFVSVLLPIGAQSARAQSNTDHSGDPPLTCPGQQVLATFSSLGEAHLYTLSPTARGLVKVTSADCCVPGDIWRVELHEQGEKKVGKSNGNSGAVDGRFSGKVSKAMIVGKPYQLLVFRDNNLSLPAGMTLCVEGQVTVTRLLP